MFIKISFLIIVGIALVHALDQPCSLEGNITQIDGSTYQCMNGTLVHVLACTSNNVLLGDGQTMKTNDFFWQCQKTGPTNQMQMVAIACIKNDHVLAPSQTYDMDRVWYTCKINPVDNNAFLETSGCIGPSGEKVKLDQTLTKGLYVFKCLSNQTVHLEPYGCSYNDQTYKFGDAVHVGQFWYTCEKVGVDGIQLQLKGCLDESAHLLPGEMFHSHGFIFKCEKLENGMRRSGWGCLEVTPKRTIVEHGFGDQWVEGNALVKYMIKCTQDGSGVGKTPVQCVFHKDAEPESKSRSLNPGCMVKRDHALLQCKKTDKGGLRSLTTENATSEDENNALLAGFQFC